MINSDLLVPDFRSKEGLFKILKERYNVKGSSELLFDSSVYRSDKSTIDFHDMIRSLSDLTQKATPTTFHCTLATIAHQGRLLRLYTQNIDCLEASLPPLATVIPLPVEEPWPVTIQLHGGLDKMRCAKCNYVADFDASLFHGSQLPLCALCKDRDNQRTEIGKRSHGIGRMRPRITLYNDDDPDQEAIDTVREADLATIPDAVLVVGTSLKVEGAKKLARDMCQATHSCGGLTAWINLDSPPNLADPWDFIIRGSSDQFASLLHPQPGPCQLYDRRQTTPSSEVPLGSLSQPSPSVRDSENLSEAIVSTLSREIMNHLTPPNLPPPPETVISRPLFFDIDTSMKQDNAIALFEHYFPRITFHPQLCDSKDCKSLSTIHRVHWVYTALALYDIEGLILRKEQLRDYQVMALVRWQLLDLRGQV